MGPSGGLATGQTGKMSGVPYGWRYRRVACRCRVSDQPTVELANTNTAWETGATNAELSAQGRSMKETLGLGIMALLLCLALSLTYGRWTAPYAFEFGQKFRLSSMPQLFAMPPASSS